MKAQNRFWWILRLVRREMSTASATRRGSLRIRVTPAACMATSVPPPMAKPTSAAARAGASLTPSPTMPTLPSAARAGICSALSPGGPLAPPTGAAVPNAAAAAFGGQGADLLGLVARQHLGAHVVRIDADRGRHGTGGAGVVARKHDRADAHPVQGGHRLDRFRPRRIAECEQPAQAQAGA